MIGEWERDKDGGGSEREREAKKGGNQFRVSRKSIDNEGTDRIDGSKVGQGENGEASVDESSRGMEVGRDASKR